MVLVMAAISSKKESMVNYRYVIACAVACGVLGAAYADQITLHNKTDDVLYAAVYYAKGDKSAAITGAIVELQPDTTGRIDRPSSKSGLDRELFVTPVHEQLVPSLDSVGMQSIRHHNIGPVKMVNATTLYFNYKDSGVIGIYLPAEWDTLFVQRGARKAADATFDALLAPIRKAFDSSIYAKQKVAVTIRTSGLSSDEQAYLDKRTPRVKAAVEKLIGHPIFDKQIPRIALCCSGGGYRAMIATLGDFLGADEYGLLDAVTYVVGLSGSTWAIAGWMTSGLSVDAYIKQLSPRLSQDLLHGDISQTQVTNALLRKKVFSQPISLIDVYGALLGQKILKGLNGQSDPNDIHLTQQVDRVKTANVPFPIYTAIIAPDRPAEPYRWVEFTPYEFGSEYLGAWIPVWATGQEFHDGSSIRATPPQPLGYFMGIWGSAFSANLHVMLEEYIAKIGEPAKTVLKGMISLESVGDTRVSPAHMYNPTFGMAGKPLSMRKKLTLIDAGLDFNNPLVPLVRADRHVDIIIILDQSKTISEQQLIYFDQTVTSAAPELKKAELYFKKQGIAFAPIDYTQVTRTCSIHKDPLGKLPVIIYMPRIGVDTDRKDYAEIAGNKGAWSFIDTSNFAYTQAQVERWSQLTRDNMQKSKHDIIKVITEVVERKA